MKTSSKFNLELHILPTWLTGIAWLFAEQTMERWWVLILVIKSSSLGVIWLQQQESKYQEVGLPKVVERIEDEPILSVNCLKRFSKSLMEMVSEGEEGQLVDPLEPMAVAITSLDPWNKFFGIWWPDPVA